LEFGSDGEMQRLEHLRPFSHLYGVVIPMLVPEPEAPELLTDVAMAAAGDRAAFTRLVEAHADSMARVAVVITGDRDLAADAVQQAWHLAWRRLSQIEDATKIRSWLMTVVANEARQLLRKRRPTVPIEAVNVAVALPGGDAAIDLAAALGHLSAEDRALLSLRYVAGFTSGELADATGRSASGVRVLLSRLLARLREELGDE
jgi:RNA polymerase sigma-70 factor (ECF subfamily)